MAARIQPITMPKWGIEMQEGTITTWHVAAGQAIGKGDTLLDVETDKIVNSIESPIAGVLRRVIADTGSVQPVGALIALCADADVGEAEVDAFVAAFKPVDASFEPASASTAAAAPHTGTEPVAAAGTEGESRVSPIARRLAEKLGIDPQLIKGTGRNGRVSKEDVETYAAARGASSTPATAPPSPLLGTATTRQKMSATRLVIARRLLESTQNIPHYRLAVDVVIDALLTRRAGLKAAGTVVSLNDLLLRAVALALVRHPTLNAELHGDDVVQHHHANLCIAVATDGGILAPVVQQAELKSASEIAAATASLAERARAGRLTREDVSGGSFTVSNLGMFGVDRFDAIINPPQVATLAVGRGTARVIARDGAPAIATVMTLTLSCDHRVVDGAVGAAYLSTLRELIETAEQL